MHVHLLLVLPIFLPLTVAVVLFLFRKVPRVQQWVNLAGMVSLVAVAVMIMRVLAAEGMQATTLGSWPPPFGITLVADHLSMIMVIVTAIMGVVIAVYAMVDIDDQRVRFGFYPFMNLLVAGVNGAFLTGDIFNLYVWFEVLLIASFILLVLGNERAQLAANIKYVAINLVSSLFFLAGVGLLYGVSGSLNMAEIALALQELDNPGLITTIGMLFLVAFGIKAAIFPLFFWLPASYHTPPPTIIALFAGLLTKVGVYALMRVFTLLFTADIGFTHTILLWVAGFTMVTGVLGAAVQTDFRRILSFHIISQIGYMIMGLALFTPLALVGGIYYVVHNIFAKSNLFLISGVAERLQGTFSLKKLKGLYASYPYLTIMFLLSAFALGGFPPLSGFWGKLILAIAALETADYVIVFVAFAVGMMTMFSMTKIWMYSFLPGKKAEVIEADGASTDGGDPLHAAPGSKPLTRNGVRLMLVPITLVCILIVGISIGIGPAFEVGERAANELMNASIYIEAVMGAETVAFFGEGASGADVTGVDPEPVK